MDRYIDKIIKASKYKAIAFKKEQNKLYDCIIDFCSKEANNNVILLNKNINQLYENDTDFEMTDLEEDFTFNIFSTEPQEISKKLAESIYKNYSKYITIHIYLRGSENIISIDNDKVIYVYKYASKEIKLNENSILYKFEKKDIYFLDSLTLLFFMTRDLYHPSVFLDICRNKQNNIFNSFCKIMIKYIQHNQETIKEEKYRFIENIINVEGGRKSFIVKRPASNKKSIEEIKQFITKIIIEIIKLDAGDILLIEENKYDNIISSKSFSLIKDLKNKIEKKFKQTFRYIISDFFVFNDFRFKRITLMNQNGDRLLTVFNNLEYEAIPIVKKNVIHPLVNIRYELFNLMTYIHYSNSSLDKKKYTIKMSLEKCIELLKLSKTIKTMRMIEYVGEYKDDRIEKFKIGATAWRPKS